MSKIDFKISSTASDLIIEEKHLELKRCWKTLISTKKICC